ncbi:MAG: glycoside hydrolase family 65 protein [Candidatus Latescibacterota bacterium]|nr:MAG: glycoside hydrolase family 65 protein [Candidatus Latescibacterota bacterium]
MLHRERSVPPEYIYPFDEWKMIERRFDSRFLAQSETIFATANGYMGMRGNFEEGAPVAYNGTYINAFHETWPIVYGEEAHGFAKTGQTMLNVTDCRLIKLYVDDEPLYLPTANLLQYERTLNMQAGTLERELVWEMASGKRVSVKSRRLVSFQHRHLAAVQYEVTLLNAKAPVVLSSEMAYAYHMDDAEQDPRKTRGFKQRPLSPSGGSAKDCRILLSHKTRNSKMTLACGVDHVIETACNYSHTLSRTDDSGKSVFAVEAQPGQPIRLTKFISYHTSRSAPPEALRERTDRTLDRAMRDGFSQLLEEQRAFLDDFWSRSDVEIEGDAAVQQYIRWNLFQLCQASARAEGAGIGARGLTGDTYEGHYFWDTEIYVLPFLIYTEPRIARNLLKFRHSMLEKARQRAREVGHPGALFPWRTINGDEASAYYAAGTAQYHINADIMYALKKYAEITGDVEFLHREGAEMLVETARLWVDLGFFSSRADGRFRIHAVTGPDEYATVVNDNTYTNLMARENLRFAVRTVETLRKDHPERFTELVDKTQLEVAEVAIWKRAAEQMYIPFDEKLGIHPQDDTFLEREVWDFENTPHDKYPLLLHFHPLVLYRHQVIKQADVALAMFLLGNEFTPEQKKRNFDYYDPLTTGDSSLSVSIQSIIAFEIGYIEKAREYARYAAMMDLADVGGNVKHGAHIASIGGTWLAIVFGFAGLRDYDGQLSFNPRLPKRIGHVRFCLTVRGQRLQIEMDRSQVRYSLQDGKELTIRHAEQELRVTLDAPAVVAVDDKPGAKVRSRESSARRR